MRATEDAQEESVNTPFEMLMTVLQIRCEWAMKHTRMSRWEVAEVLADLVEWFDDRRSPNFIRLVDREGAFEALESQDAST